MTKEYDGVLVLESPNDETIMSFLLEAESKGNFRSMTLKASPMSEVAKVIEKFKPYNYTALTINLISCTLCFVV